jgi:capsular polysaccharide biosynthesis protein
MDYIKELVYPAEQVERNKPILMPYEDEYLFASELKKDLPTVSPIEISESYLLPNGILINGWRISENQFGIRLNLKGLIKLYLKTIKSLFRVKKIINLKNVLFVTNPNSDNFFHWFLDVLQKLEYIESKASVEFLNNYIIVLPATHRGSFFQKSLEAYNVIFYYQKKDELLFFKNTILVPNLAPTGNYRKATIQKMAGRLRSHWPSVGAGIQAYKRIYITRKNAIKRKITNEEEILPILRENGFLILDFDTLSFDEQVIYIMNCDFLVSLHGAGLTHMLWMKDQSRVLEIRANADCHNNCYFTLASDLGHKYFYTFAEKNNLEKLTQEANFSIDVGNFEAALKKAINL